MGKGEKSSLDSKVVSGAAGCCSLLGLLLLVIGLVVYLTNAEAGGHTCVCVDEAADECCKEVPSVCDECWCTHVEESDGYCSDFEDTSSHGAGGLGISIAGLIVCAFGASMLITMRTCKDWSEKNLHIRYPQVIPGDQAVDC